MNAPRNHAQRFAGLGFRAVTKRQGRLLAFIRSYSTENGYAPSFAEMKAVVGASTNALSNDLDILAENCLLRRLTNRARAVEVIAPVITGHLEPVIVAEIMAAEARG